MMITKDVHERLNCCLSESNDSDVIASEIMSEFRLRELEQAISHLVGVYDKLPDLLHLFWQRSSDACPLEASEMEKQENEWKIWVYKNLHNPKN